MRRLIFAIAFGFTAASHQLTATGDPASCHAGLNGTFITCDGETSPQQGSSSTVVRTIGTGSNTTTRWHPYNQLATGTDGHPCVRTAYFAEGSPPNDAALTDPVTQNIQDMHNLAPLEYPPCPLRPSVQGEPASVETPWIIAMRYWEQVPLPRPAPYIAPGRAITGKTAYLETRGRVTQTYTNPSTPYGQLTIVATGSYEVDWGDGTASKQHAAEGEAWPNGQITHIYTHVGFYDIRVTERWTATWSLGGEQGRLRTLATSGFIDDFPVEQIQAVVGR